MADDLPAPKGRTGAPKPPPQRAASRKKYKPPPAEDMGDDDFDNDVPDLEPIPFTNDEVHRVEQLMAKRAGVREGMMKYPVELPENHKSYWSELVNSFPHDHFTTGDIVAMKLYCRCAHDIDRCNKMIEAEGDVIQTGRGPAVNPRVKVRSASESTLMNILTKFRNQPASRANSEDFQMRQGKKTLRDEGNALAESDEDDLLGGREATKEKNAMSRAASYVN